VSATESMEEIDLGMSNFDRVIDAGFAEALRDIPGKAFGRYSGWNFNARVWFDSDLFHAEVWVYGSPVKIIRERTLENIMVAVCEEFGSK